MALAVLLRDWARCRGRHLTALIVDHGIRDGSDAEARLVSERLSAASVPNVVLRWDGAKPTSGLQARARDYLEAQAKAAAAAQAASLRVLIATFARA